jgi:MT-A70
LEARGRSREEFVDLVSRQNILDDEKVAECFEKGKTGIIRRLPPWAECERGCCHTNLDGRGDIPAPAPGSQWPSVIEAQGGAHSEKPDVFYDLIEAYFPNLPKLELFARRRREGWDAWGNEI